VIHHDIQNSKALYEVLYAVVAVAMGPHRKELDKLLDLNSRIVFLSFKSYLEGLTENQNSEKIRLVQPNYNQSNTIK
jgi:hypothetical protein